MDTIAWEPGHRADRRAPQMSDVHDLIARANEAVAAGLPDVALELSRRAVEEAATPDAKFETLLFRARAEVGAGELQRALDTYWEARHVTKKHRLGRAGEADLGIGM